MARKRDPVMSISDGTAREAACFQRSLRRNGIKGAEVKLNKYGNLVVFVQSLRVRRLHDWDARVARAERSCKL